MSNTHQILYFPFCQEGYWPTIYDAIEKMREICRNGRKIDVYLNREDAISVAESTVFDDETWIVVEIKVYEDYATAGHATSNCWAEVEFDSWLVQHFNVQPNV